MSSVTLRRCTVIGKTGKTLYDGVLAQAEAHPQFQLANNALGETFFPSNPDRRGNLYYEKADGTPFVANFVAEIGSQEEGTHLAAYPKSLPPPSKLVMFLFLRPVVLLTLPFLCQPMNDEYLKSHRMVVALRCPSEAPADLRKLFRNGAARADSIRGADEQLEAEMGEVHSLITLRSFTHSISLEI